MQIWLGVENFAKIESARVCINRYTLLVGQNNSGKTFLMQLIQGVLEKIIFLIDTDVLDILSNESVEEYDSYILTSNNIAKFVQYLNDKFQKEKDHIVREIFGKDIPIGKLYIDISMSEDIIYTLYILDGLKYNRKNAEEIIEAEWIHRMGNLFLKRDQGKIFVLDEIEKKNETFHTILAGIGAADSLIDIVCDSLDKILNLKSLFLPASRTGLLLLYREFFVNKTDYAISYEIGESRTLKNNESYGGLTKSVYEFLRFLQRYSENKYRKEVFKKELQFFEDHVIEGHINIDSQKVFFYQSKDDENETPMYLSSSMINETAPIAMAIISDEGYRRLIVDEIEASMHPEKQLEIVRFLNRMYRKGMSLVVSTHSDTFVSKINNLYILSHYKQQLKDDNMMADILNTLGLNMEDLINVEDLCVYEFVIQPNGKSLVKEIKGNEKTGFQFDLFTDSAMKIYDENLRIGELQL